MPTLEEMAPATPQPSPQPELHLLLPSSTFEQPIWKSLAQNLNDFFFPKKQPPLVLTSKPIPVREIWGFYDNKRSGALGSTIFHVIVVAAIILATILAGRAVKTVINPDHVVLIAPTDDIPAMAPSKKVVAGGGGGGDRDKFQAPK